MDEYNRPNLMPLSQIDNNGKLEYFFVTSNSIRTQKCVQLEIDVNANPTLVNNKKHLHIVWSLS